MKKLSLQEFRSTKKLVENKDCPDHIREMSEYPCLVYAGGCYIEVLPGGCFMLQIENHGWIAETPEELEPHLYDWYLGMIVSC